MSIASRPNGAQPAAAGPAWIVVGGMNVDRLGVADGAISGADSWPGRIVESPGGVGRNIAENIARLGLPVRLVSVVGADRDGDWLVERCAQAGIDTGSVFRTGERPTGRYLAVADRHGILVAAISDMSVLEALDADRLAGLQAILGQARGIVVDANLAAGALRQLFESAKGPPLYVDAVSHAKAARLKSWLARIHTLKLNLHEAAAITGRQLAPEAQARWLLDAGVRQVLLSLGRDGVVFADADAVTQYPSAAVTVVSDTGAGDALFAGFIAAEAMGYAVADKIGFAQGCAALTLGGPAANHPELSVDRVEPWHRNR